MGTLKSSLQSEIIYLLMYLSFFLVLCLLSQDKKQTDIYYFFLKTYRKKSLFPSKINIFFYVLLLPHLCIIFLEMLFYMLGVLYILDA